VVRELAEATVDDRDRQLASLREERRAVADVLRAVARSEGLGVVFDAALEAANRLCDGEYGSLYMVDGELFRQVTQLGGSPENAEYERSHPHTKDRHTLVGRVAVTEQTVHIHDALADPDYSWPGQGMGGYLYRAMLGVPIFVDDELIGVFVLVRNEPKPFTDEQIELIETFADQASIAIANARLIDAVERQRTELSRFLSPRIAELSPPPRASSFLPATAPISPASSAICVASPASSRQPSRRSFLRCCGPTMLSSVS
jgi:two-component system, NtrC family, sensor kinase